MSPLIQATAGNVGVQSSAIVVQGLANDTLKGNIAGRLLKETALALINGLSIALIVLIFSHLFFNTTYLESISIGLAVVVVILIAALVGTFVPMLLDKKGIDPAVATGPFITTSNDVFGILIYFFIAKLILGIYIQYMKILHIDQNHPVLWSELSVLGYKNTQGYSLTREEVLSIIESYDGVVIRSRILIDRAFLDAAKQLKFIARVGAGLDAIDTDYAAEKGVLLISAPEGNSNAVGEHALGLLLNLLNNINRADRELRQGLWRREPNRGHELSGHTVGIIGYGHMGKAFAKTLRGLDCPVICYDIKPEVGDQNAHQVTLEQFFAQAQVVSLHTPLTPETEFMINAEFIEKFAHNIYLINTARGRSVVTQDLVAALERGKVLGAGLDVLEYEHSSFEKLHTQELPEALKVLLSLDNVILSPHIAGWTHQSKEKLAQVIVAKIQNHFPIK